MNSIVERLFQRCGHHYLLVMMILSRMFGSVGGLLVIYYVELTLKLPGDVRTHFRMASIVVVVIACTLTVLLALWETRVLRQILRQFGRGEPADPQQAAAGAREAVVFATRHHWHEAWLVPCSTLVPVLIFLKLVDDASLTILGNITVAVFMGIAVALMSTFFVIEHCMQPVIRSLLDRGIPVDFDSLPAGHLRFRAGICFTLIIMTTSLMIGTMARQRAADILQGDDRDAAEAVRDLRVHSTYITIVAVLVGVTYSAVLANSVASRADRLVHAMKRVEHGHLTERVLPTGTDEIDVLTRQFNTMVGELQRHHETIRELNLNLEGKVKERTHQLEVALEELQEAQSRLTEVAHRAGMAEVATGVLHNVGNVLNSVNISTSMLQERLRRTRIADLGRLTQRLNKHRDDLAAFLTKGHQAAKLLEYLAKLSQRLETECSEQKLELQELAERVDHIRGIISAQQNYARRITFREELDVCRLVNDVLGLHRVPILEHQVEVVTNFAELPTAHFEKSKLVQVADNLIKNAIEAMSQSDGPRRLAVEVNGVASNRAQIVVSDTGQGIAPEDLKSIFNYGFTTKRTGNGFGLHSSALAISDLGGTIKAFSNGPGCGTTFVVEFPLVQDADDPSLGEAREEQPVHVG